MPRSYPLLNNRKKLTVPQTHGTSDELFRSNPVSGRRHTCACQDPGLHGEIPVQHGVFSILYEERVRWFCKQLSFGYRCLCASPAKQNKIMQNSERTGGRKPTLRHYIHLKLNMCKAHLVMVPFRELHYVDKSTHQMAAIQKDRLESWVEGT